jgi:hypothetical protein
MSPLAVLAAVLTITVWPQGPKGPSATHVVRCPDSAVCARLASVPHPFAPVPRGAACTLIYGGPKVALVRGTYGGRRVRAWFNRSNGCEIARWNRVAFLFRSS